MIKKALCVVTFSFSLASCTGAIDPGFNPGTGAAGQSATGQGLTGQGATGAVGQGATGAAGQGATGAAGQDPTGAAGTGVASTGAGGATTACGPSAIPADVAAVISSRCVACHGSPPIAGVPSSLTTYASLTAPSKTDPAKSVVALALARMQPGAPMPMPPAGLQPSTASEVAAFASWVSAGTPAATCAADGGAPSDAGGIVDPYATPVVCTSKTMWTRGNNGSGSMDPGQACIACHAMSADAPKFALGGTIFPTAHEPNDCNGGTVATMSQVVIKGADGKAVTLTPNAAGNFYYQGALAKPYTAKVTYMGRERAMIAAQTSGDCNSCHTEAGLMMAPGRIMLP